MPLLEPVIRCLWPYISTIGESVIQTKRPQHSGGSYGVAARLTTSLFPPPHPDASNNRIRMVSKSTGKMVSLDG